MHPWKKENQKKSSAYRLFPTSIKTQSLKYESVPKKLNEVRQLLWVKNCNIIWDRINTL